MTASAHDDEDRGVDSVDDDLTPVRARKCARSGCETIITCGPGAPMFCSEHDELNP